LPTAARTFISTRAPAAVRDPKPSTADGHRVTHRTRRHRRRHHRQARPYPARNDSMPFRSRASTPVSALSPDRRLLCHDSPMLAHGLGADWGENQSRSNSATVPSTRPCGATGGMAHRSWRRSSPGCLHSVTCCGGSTSATRRRLRAATRIAERLLGNCSRRLSGTSGFILSGRSPPAATPRDCLVTHSRPGRHQPSQTARVAAQAGRSRHARNPSCLGHPLLMKSSRTRFSN